jgi:hypothetical protein
MLLATSTLAVAAAALAPVYVRHVNGSVNDPRGYGYRRCGDINLAALSGADGESVFKDAHTLSLYANVTVQYFTEYKLEHGSCRDAGFIYPPRNCVADPRPSGSNR